MLLISSDNQEFEVSDNFIFLCKTLSHLVEDTFADSVHLPISGSILKTVIEYSTNENGFHSMLHESCNNLVKILNAADYLDYDGLINTAYNALLHNITKEPSDVGALPEHFSTQLLNDLVDRLALEEEYDEAINYYERVGNTHKAMLCRLVQDRSSASQGLNGDRKEFYQAIIDAQTREQFIKIMKTNESFLDDWSVTMLLRIRKKYFS